MNLNQRLLIAALAFLSANGCSGPNAQLTSCQQEKEQLLATIRQQRDTTRDLHQQVVSLETRLDQAEKQLAGGMGTTRLSSRSLEASPPTKSESLPWRSHSPKRNSPPNDARLRGATLIDADVSFDGQTASLTAESKRQLDDAARLLKGDEAKDKRIMVAGYAAGRPSTTSPALEGEERFTSARQLAAARAQAVADYLDRHGIAQERLAVTGIGSQASPASQDSKSANGGGVQIYLLEPNAPVLGWDTGEQPLRR